MITVKADNVVYKLYTRRARHGEIRVKSPYWDVIYIRTTDGWRSKDGKWIPMIGLELELEATYQLHVKV